MSGERWDLYFSTLMNAIPATIGRDVIEHIAQRPIASSPGDAPSTNETEKALRAKANSKVTDLGGLLAEILNLWTERGAFG